MRSKLSVGLALAALGASMGGFGVPDVDLKDRTHYPKRPPGSVARDKRMARKRRNVRARSAK